MLSRAATMDPLLEKEDAIFPRDARIHKETLRFVRQCLEMSKGNRRVILLTKVQLEVVNQPKYG